MSLAVSLRNVSKLYRYGDTGFQALSDISLDVERGTIQGVIGSSGAGKSTLLRCISLLEKPDTGRVLVDGIDLATLQGATLRTARQKIGIIFQQFHLLRSRTVYGNVALPLELAGKSHAETEARVMDLLRWFGLEEKAQSYPMQLSGGQRQRVAVARALATNPSVLLSDEPTSALDPETTASVLDLLRRVRDEFGVTVILITHELDAVRAICDRVAVLQGGCIVEEGPVEDVLLHPMTDATRRMLHNRTSVEPFFDGRQVDSKEVTTILELKTVGSSAVEPLLSEIARALEVDVVLLQGDIGRLHNTPYASLVLAISGKRHIEAEAFLQARGASVRIASSGSKSGDAL
jgi:D-methionine transport system ATP-binding protein